MGSQLNNSTIMVFCEICEDGIVDNSLQLLSEAKRLIIDFDKHWTVLAVLIGEKVFSFASEIFIYGADKVVCVEDPLLKTYRSDLFGHVLACVVNKEKPEVILIGATSIGSELAPTLGARLKTGVAAHCIELRFNEEKKLVQIVPAFGGKVLAEILTQNTFPQIASVKSGIFQKEEFPVTSQSIVEQMIVPLEGFDRITEADIISDDIKEGKPINETEVIVGGGYGVGSKEDWLHLEELADLLSGATGCTRPALDEGWGQGEYTMIGTSGVTVHPKIYFSVGISGAAHHLCGIRDSGIIISINKDKNAPMLQASDYVVVEDYKKIIPLLIEKLKSIRKKRVKYLGGLR